MASLWTYVCLCLLFLVIVCTGQQCGKNVSVEVTSSGTVVLPIVNIILWTSERNATWSNCYFLDHDNKCHANESGSYFMTVDSTTYNVTIDLQESALSCEDITLDLQVTSRSFLCIPVSSCGHSNTITTIRWMKSYYIDDDDIDDLDNYQSLVNGSYDKPVDFDLRGLLGHQAGDRIEISDAYNGSVTITNGTLKLLGATARSAGHYIAVGDTDDVILYRFTLYFGPNFFTVPAAGSAKATLGQNNFDKFYCLFQSFPSTRVTWLLQNQNINQANVRYYNITEETLSENVMMPNFSSLYDYTWTVSGQIIIMDVQYDNSGRYSCSGTNGYMTASHSRLLRVQSPLRPLWPVLGIIASFIVTGIFIAGGYIVDKIRGEDKVTINQDEIDGNTSMPEKPLRENDSFSGNYGAFRPLSVNSFNDEDTKELYRRSSSAKELLPNIQTS